MQDEDKIFGLIAQAEDLQKYALTLQDEAKAAQGRAAAVECAVRESAKVIIAAEVKNASKGISDASEGVMAAVEQLRGITSSAWLIHAFYLSLVAVVISAAIYFGLGFLIKKQVSELDELTVQVQAMQKTAAALKNQYGKAQIIFCDGRPCIRIDEDATNYFGPGRVGTYRILFGY